MVLRPRLVERLREVLQRKLTVVSAPAGFGKTTLISEWIAACQQLSPQVRAAWLSLDEGDNELTRFLTYLIAALQMVAPSIGADLVPLLQESQPPTDSLLTALLNEIARIPDHILLILDDYHLIDAKAVDEALSFMIEYLPPQVHLIIATREDPPLNLARLRARGQLTEVRVRDLRFSPSEATEFLNRGMALNLSAADIAALEERTEGWIAGLQLAALSLQGHQDSSGFIRAFAGDHRYIVYYLVSDVLDSQSDSIRQFLLQTAILDRFNASLCDAVSGSQKSKELLESLERGNFFLIPLDDKRQWYRYHHLFADVLSAHLMAEQPDQIAELHRRASTWYAHNDWLPEAIQHALVAQDFQQAATLIERAMSEMRRSRQEALLLSWLQALPEEIFRSRPSLSIHYVGTLLQLGRLEGIEARLDDAERWLTALLEQPDSPVAGVESADWRRWSASVAMYRGALALIRGDAAAALRCAGQGLEVAPDDDDLLRGSTAGILALGNWALGDLEAAERWYSECINRLERIGHYSDAIGCSLALADIRLAQGRLRGAMSAYEHGLQLADQSKSLLRGTADMYVGMSQLAYERGTSTAAVQYLSKSEELGVFAELPQNQYRWCVAMARLRQSEGELDEALDLLQEAERLYQGDFSPNVRPIPALKARLWIAQGKLDAAVDWARERRLAVEDDLSYLHEFEYVTLARLRLAQYQRDREEHCLREAVSLLDRLLSAAEAGRRAGSVIEILVVQALAHQQRGDLAGALAALERALTLAEPEHYLRLFVDEGSAMKTLLEEAAKRHFAPNYVQQLLSATGTPEVSTATARATSTTAHLSEPLSDRELDVLRLLGTDLSGPEIADQLVISLNTLRTHTKNIYSKLGVGSRRAAVRRADDLNLL
ncbi:MAG: LuxR C-terminal-related transcriptional regulator [Anaerolineae bacterium]